MTLSATPVYAQTPQAWGAVINNSTGIWTFAQTGTVNALPLVAGGANGANVEAINVSTNDTTVTYDYLILFLNDGTNNYILSVFQVPIGSGTSATIPPYALLSGSQAPSLPFDSNGNPYLYVPAGMTLYIANASNAAINSGKFVSVVATGSAF